MKAMLLILTILMFSVNGFAKTKVQKKSSKDAYKFDLNVYYKLKFPDRQKYLEMYVNFTKEVEAEMQAENKSRFDLYNLLFPTADAADASCNTGGIYYEPPCKALTSAQFPDDLKTAFSGCTSNNRCAAYWGLDSSGNGLCWKTEGKKLGEHNATGQCAAQSSPEAIQRLNQALANQYDAKSKALQKALDIDLNKNAGITKFCLDKASNKRKGACAKLAKGVEDFRNKAGGTGTDITTNDQSGKGCTSAEAGAIDAVTRKATDPVWYKMLTMAAAGGCPGGVSYEEMVRKVGICEAYTGDDGAARPNVEEDIRNMDNLRNAIHAFQNQKTPEKGDQWNSFTRYFGVTPDEFKDVLCLKTSGQVYGKVFGDNGSDKLGVNAHGGDGDMFKKRRANFKQCVKNNIKKETINSNGEQIDKFVSKDAGKVCRFKPATANFDDILANPSKYKGKYFFSDNAGGNCYGLDRVSKNCHDIGDWTEKQTNKLFCTAADKGADGTVSMNQKGYFRLNPVHKSDNSVKLVDSENLSKNFMFYEYDCGSSVRCTSENNYCNDKTKEGDAAVK